jgi:hypothetical protein
MLLVHSSSHAKAHRALATLLQPSHRKWFERGNPGGRHQVGSQSFGNIMHSYESPARPGWKSFCWLRLASNRTDVPQILTDDQDGGGLRLSVLDSGAR